MDLKYRLNCFVACKSGQPCQCLNDMFADTEMFDNLLSSNNATNRGTARLNSNVMVRTKVKCYEIATFMGWDSKLNKKTLCRKFKFQIVGSDSEENNHFFHISGGTNIELQTINQDIFDHFQIDGEYYCDFSGQVNVPLPKMDGETTTGSSGG